MARTVSPAMIGNGSAASDRQATKSKPKNGISQTIARLMPISDQLVIRVMAALTSAPTAMKAPAIGKIAKGPPGRMMPAKVAIRMPLRPGFGADPALDHLARQQDGDEGGDQAARQHLRQNIDEQIEIAPQHRHEAVGAVAEIDVACRRGHDRNDHRRGPVEGGMAAPARRRRVRLFGQRDSPAASRASAVMRAKSPDATASFGATQEPPTQTTFGKAR